ncbi:MAG: DUF4339 domain-containing protein [Planctomycetaceae bacterium]|nr:DUF4339 domain-containing protein [Planctomycetaceae bacterium]
MKYFYYNEKGEKKGAFSGKEIKALAKGGLINPQTIIETEEGEKYYAHGIGGVEFGGVMPDNPAEWHIPVKTVEVPLSKPVSSTTLYFYYNKNGHKQGAYTKNDINAYAKAGIITPETIIELAGGQQCCANEIVGIEFESTSSKNATHSEVEYVALKSQLLHLENMVRTQKSPRHTTVLDIVFALVIFFFGIPAILWFLLVASCRMGGG